MTITKQNRRNRAADGSPNPTDIHIGKKLRERRLQLGMSQSAVGDAMGMTCQQIHKYEKGANRIGGSRLFDLSRALECSIGYFFDGLEVDGLSAEQIVAEDHEPVPLALLRNYRALPAPMRVKLGEIARVMAAA